jgi:hypothetical protein
VVAAVKSAYCTVSRPKVRPGGPGSLGPIENNDDLRNPRAVPAALDRPLPRACLEVT